jgi:hypothetical protein
MRCPNLRRRHPTIATTAAKSPSPIILLQRKLVLSVRRVLLPQRPLTQTRRLPKWRQYRKLRGHPK